MRFRILMALAVVSVFAAPAAAQSLAASPSSQVRAARRATEPIGFRVYGFYETVSLKASETFGAQFNTSRLDGVGLGGEVLNLWRGVFVRGAFSRATMTDGSRGFVIDGTFYPTNVPLEVEINPFEFGAGWRHALGSTGRVAVYGGASFVRVSYTETAEFEELSEGIDVSDTGYAVFGGVDALVWRNVFAGAELQVRSIADALGQSPVDQEPESVSFAFGETDLGGTVFRLLGGVRW